MLTLPAYAKINLGLEITGRRPDGYHDLVSLMQTVDLADTLTVEIVPGASGWTLTCTDMALAGEDNLVLKACRHMQERYGISVGGRISLTKRIPVAGGLGGGSSDAATMLIAINRLCGLNLSRETLMDEAAQIGSDVPFFLSDGTALIEGRGERVTPLARADVPALYDLFILLLTPNVDMPPGKTAALYKALRPTQDFSDGTRTRALIAGLHTGGALDTTLLVNSFERPLRDLVPDLADAMRLLHDAGVARVYVSGSGPSLFGLFTERDSAETAYARAKRALQSSEGGQPQLHLLRPVQTAWAKGQES